MDLDWGTCGESGAWCRLLSLNTEHQLFDGMVGVYVIWQAKGPVIRIGQGNIRDRVNAHKHDRDIIEYSNLYVTWARVQHSQLDGVERYLANELNPIVGEQFPNASPINVNLPWRY